MFFLELSVPHNRFGLVSCSPELQNERQPLVSERRQSDKMSLCTFSGNADMYGLGIRLGYYLQWYGGMLATLLAPDEVGNARISLGFFISATFLALIIQTVQHQLYSIEIYIILLLTFGAYISLLPILLWRLLTRCDQHKDPTRFPLVDPGSIHSDLHSVLLLAVTGFQL